MKLTTEQIFEAALALPIDGRAELVERLLASVDAEQAEIDEAWRAECERRIDELNKGLAQSVPAEQVFARIRAGRKS